MTSRSSSEKSNLEEQCWCRSGKKFKDCHYRRENQQPIPLSMLQAHIANVPSNIAYCSCELDPQNCSNQIVNSHSISKRATLQNIAENGHVTALVLLDFLARPLYRDGQIEGFFKVSANKASATNSFCGYHDNHLFRQLDRLDLSVPDEFAWQLFYRTLCFEIYAKRCAVAFSGIISETDRGQPLHRQQEIQRAAHIHKISHSLGEQDLMATKRRLEKIYSTKQFSQIGYSIIEASPDIPIALSGSFQPHFAPNGVLLQRTNEIRVHRRGFSAEPLQSICLSVLPADDRTFLCMTFMKEDNLSAEFAARYLGLPQDKVNAFIGLAILHIENAYFRPSFINGLEAGLKDKILFLNDCGTEEPYAFTENDVAAAIDLKLVPDNLSLRKLGNL